MRSRSQTARIAVRWSGIALLTLLVALGLTEVRYAYANADEKLTLPGVANFGRLAVNLYRGANPEMAAYPSLRNFGIDTVVRFSTGDEFIAAEKARVESLGMAFISLPWRAADLPETNQVVSFLSLVRNHPEHTYFVHCREGVDRTGVMVALYRVAIDGWSTDQAIDEMKAFHYRYLLHPHLQSYVESFPSLIATEPSLQAVSITPPGDRH
jgi:protein tyrosine phosphatase (PTP) superfamily phosphohydrolase (DUF442 family)